jgi:hypothetical protein
MEMIYTGRRLVTFPKRTKENFQFENPLANLLDFCPITKQLPSFCDLLRTLPTPKDCSRILSQLRISIVLEQDLTEPPSQHPDRYMFSYQGSFTMNAVAVRLFRFREGNLELNAQLDFSQFIAQKRKHNLSRSIRCLKSAMQSKKAGQT